jgi:hypothetical protein
MTGFTILLETGIFPEPENSEFLSLSDMRKKPIR